jgi:hypothetical protein
MRFIASLWCLVLLGLLLVAPSLRAQEAAAPADAPAAPADDLDKRKEEAKVRFQRGLELVQNESWDAALAEFLVSRELFPTRVALKNAAVCLRQLKRYVEALAMYNELIEKFSASVPPEERKTIDDAIAQLKKNVGEILVESDQKESTIVVDGQQKGTTPQPAMGVNAGTHTVRVSKEGYEAYEEQVLVAGGQRKTISAKLKPLSKIGRLSVKEASGKSLDVVVDGAVVGKTPFQGVVAAGPHTVLLKGEGNLGTAPTPADVKENQASNLTLSAVELDAEIRIEPTPANARVDVDGVQIGNGVWEGRLPSGVHKLEIAADGFVAYRKDVRLNKGKREIVKVVLERDLSNPMWSAGFVPHLYVEAFAGGAIAMSFSGGADEACSAGDCSDSSLPLGFIAGARGGYQLTKGLGVELGLGYLSMSESMTRSVSATGETNAAGEATVFTSTNYEDKTTFSGPFAAISAAYHFLDDTPLTFRVAAGAARVKATFKNGGTFNAILTNPCNTADPNCDPSETEAISQDVQIPERDASIWVPFVAPEVRFGYRFSKKFMLDIGAAVFFMLPPETPRTGDNALSLSEGQRRTALDDVPDAFENPPSNARPGLVSFPKENGFGTFFAIMPTIAGRFDF